MQNLVLVLRYVLPHMYLRKDTSPKLPLKTLVLRYVLPHTAWWIQDGFLVLVWSVNFWVFWNTVVHGACSDSVRAISMASCRGQSLPEYGKTTVQLITIVDAAPI
jgi:hypothetical protein